jgi:TolB-like protein
MAGRILFGLTVVLIASTVFGSCAMFDGISNKSKMKKTADEDGEAEVVIMRPRDKQGGRVGIYLDGEISAHLGAGQSTKLIVKQGDHTLFAEWESGRRSAQGNTVVFSANLDRTVFRTMLNNGGMTLILEGKTALRSGGGPVTVRSQLDTAIDQAFGTIEGTLASIEVSQGKDRLTIAIMDIISSDAAQSEYITSGLVQRFVALQKYNVVERSRYLDAVKREVSTQLSGDVADESAVTIGKQLGAAIVITGRITRQEPSSILQLRAIDVMTAGIVQITPQLRF